MQLRHRQAVVPRTTAPVPSRLPERQLDQCYGNWEWAVTDSTRVLTPWVQGQISAFFKVTTEGRLVVALVIAQIRMPHGPGCPATGSVTRDHSPCHTIFSTAESRAAMTVHQQAFPVAAVILWSARPEYGRRLLAETLQ